MNHGSGATVYAIVKRPTPTFERLSAYPPMRASTLATFELVTTLPKTRSPGWTVVSLTVTERISGAASGARRGTFGGTGVGVWGGSAAADAPADGESDAEGDAEGAGLAVGVGPVTWGVGRVCGVCEGAREARAAADALAAAAGDCAGAVEPPRLQAASASGQAAIQRAVRTLHMSASFFGGPAIPLRQARGRRALKRMRA